jgi:two-component system response regulator
MKPHPLRNIDILLVEPDPKSAELIERAVRRSCPSCFLQRVGRPEEAEPYLEANGQDLPVRRLNPSLILLGLPDAKDQATIGLMQWLRNHARTKHLPVVVLSSVEDPVSIRRAYDLGASSYLVKPAKEEDLETLLGAAASYWTTFNHPPE